MTEREVFEAYYGRSIIYLLLEMHKNDFVSNADIVSNLESMIEDSSSEVDRELKSLLDVDEHRTDLIFNLLEENFENSTLYDVYYSSYFFTPKYQCLRFRKLGDIARGIISYSYNNQQQLESLKDLAASKDEKNREVFLTIIGL